MAQVDVHDRIKRRAYALWEEEGRPDGRAEEHWFRAEAELIGATAGGEAGPGTPGAGVHAARRAKAPGAAVGAGASNAAARAASSTLPNPDAPGREPCRPVENQLNRSSP